MTYSLDQIGQAAARVGIQNAKHRMFIKEMLKVPPATPDHRGFVVLGGTTYTLYTNVRDGMPELYIAAGDGEGKPLTSDQISVMIQFRTIEGLEVLERQLAQIRKLMAPPAPVAEVEHHGV